MVICGMSGIGKTTIAQHIYNSTFGNFECKSFLSNIREKSEQPGGLISLQRELLADIVKGRMVKVSNVDEGTNLIKEAIYGKRVLIILDDVNKLGHVNALVGISDWFPSGSKIIVTTTQRWLLPAQNEYKLHNVEILNRKESIQLFSWHAFGKHHPGEDSKEYVEDIVTHCGGLPLALEVIGSSLKGRRSIDVWKSALQKLKAVPDGEVVNRLKISYDSLQDGHDRNLFLDIVCFFVGEEKKHAVTILDECDFYTTVGI